MKRQFYDVKTHVSVKTIGAILITYLAYIIFPFNKNKSYSLLMKSHRITLNIYIRKKIEKHLKTIIIPSGKSTFIYKNYESISNTMVESIEDQLVKRTIVLKNPKYNNDGLLLEKGVLYVMFTPTIKSLYYYYDIKQILIYYHLVLEPSWAGYCDPDILMLANITQDPIYVGTPEKTDYEFIKRLKSNLIPLNFGASNWVDPDVFKPLDLEKEYDAIMVAVWGMYKRHHVLFKSVSKLKDNNYKLALVGVPYKSSREEIEKMIDYYDIRNNVDIYEKLKPEEVNILLNKSKVNILLSKKEGSNRTIFEGFFSGIPGIVLKNNIGVNKDYINNSTGVLISEKELPCTLKYFKENYGKYKPRKWAMNNISPARTTEILNSAIKKYALLKAEEWSKDITIKVNRPELVYYNSEDYEKYLHPLGLLDQT